MQELVTLFSAWSGQRVDPAISDAAARQIDYPGMAEYTLGPAQWDKLTASQKRDFVTVFRKLVEERYYPRWHKIFYNGKVTFLSEASVNGDTLVKTALTVGKQEDMVIWRLHPRAGELKVVSMTVGDKDLLDRLRSRFRKHLSRDGVDGLIAWLKDKLDEDDTSGTGSTAATGMR